MRILKFIYIYIINNFYKKSTYSYEVHFFKSILAVIFLTITITTKGKLSSHDIEAISITSAVSIIDYNLCTEEKNFLIRSAVYVGLLTIFKKLDGDKFPLYTCCTILGIIENQIYLQLKK